MTFNQRSSLPIYSISKSIEISTNSIINAGIGNNNLTESSSNSLTINTINNNSTIASSVKNNFQTYLDSISSSQSFWRLVVLGICMLWSTNFAVIKIILTDSNVDPSLYLAIRFTIASLVLLPSTWHVFKNFDLTSRGLLMGFCIFGAYVGQSMGLLTSTADKSAFICSMNVVWVALLVSIQTRTASFQLWASVILAVLGVGFMELKGATVPVIGDLWLFLQPLGFGTGYILLKDLMTTYPNEANAVSGLKLLGVGIACVCWAIVSHHTFADISTVLSEPKALIGLLYTGLVTSAFGVWMQSIAFKRVSATEASIILTSEPLWASLFAAVVLNERLSISDLFGGCLIIIACLSYEFNWLDKIINWSNNNSNLNISDKQIDRSIDKINSLIDPTEIITPLSNKVIISNNIITEYDSKNE